MPELANRLEVMHDEVVAQANQDLAGLLAELIDDHVVHGAVEVGPNDR